jgi:peptidyl-prolyl cis-trans isomerase C
MQGSKLTGAFAVALLGGTALGQGQAPAPTPPNPPAEAPAAARPPAQATPASLPAPAPNAVAATVNGQAITEVALYRGLRQVPSDKQDQARTEILKFLIDNTLIDQYLQQQKVAVDPKEVEAKLKEIRDEVQKQGTTFEKMMQDMQLGEPELRAQIAAQLRWERYAAAQATEPALKALFDSNRTLFDGTLVRARHILLSPPAGDAQAHAAAKARLAGIKAAVEKKAADEQAKLPPQTDNLEREKARAKCLEETFGEFAGRESACPSKAQGGNLGWFPYSSMVEPFAKTAFSLKPYQLSDVITTQFGYHLILVTDRRPGKEPKFEEVKDDVKEIFLERLREGLCTQLRQTAKIVMSAPGRPGA